MRVLVTWGSKRGGTEGIGRMIADVLESSGHDVVAAAADQVGDLGSFEAVVVGGALYANRWASTARRFVRHNVDALRRVPVWLFSSGPLDDSAERADIPPTTEVAVLAERIGAQGHVTFGGRLEDDARGFPASAMAQEMSGDWRDPDRIRAWAGSVARELPRATPNPAVDPPGGSTTRLLAYGLVGWGLDAAALVALQAAVGGTTALVIRMAATVLIFAALAWRYFGARGARDPLPTALVWTAVAVGLSATFVVGVGSGARALASVPGTWLPLALLFLTTFATGGLMATLPWSEPGEDGAGDG